MSWKLDRVSVTYRLQDGSLVAALRDVSLEIKLGERLAIVGPNGAGKSALALCLAGLIAPTKGSVSTPGAEPHRGGSAAEEQNWAGLVFQNPDDNLISRTVREEMGLTLEHAFPATAARPAVTDTLGRFHIDHLTDRHIARLSGGEKQVLAVACVLAAQRRLIVLDEPTSHLDPPSRRELLNLLLAHDYLLQPGTDQSAAIALITQYPGEARRFPRIVELNEGGIVYDGPSAEWLAPELQTPALFEMVEELRPNRRPIIGVSNLNQIAQPGWPLPPTPLRNISLSIFEGAAIGLCGPIGSGKSTLAFHLARLIESPSGSVISSYDSDGRQNPVVLIQFPERQLFCPTVLEDVVWGPEQKGTAPEIARVYAERLLERLQLPPGEFGNRSPFALSGGQRRRVAIAGVAVCQAPLYILDEPTAALDAYGVARLEDVLREWHHAGVSYVIISHDLNWLARVTDRVWVMEKGQIEFDGFWNDRADLPLLLERLGFGDPGPGLFGGASR